MSKNMSPSEKMITRPQADKLYNVIIMKLCNNGALLSEPTQFVIENQGAEIADAFVADVRRRVEARQRATEPHILKRQPFNLEQFLGKGWKIDEQVGKRTGGNLDAGQITRKDYLKSGERYINGEERLQRIKVAPDDIQLGGEDFFALYKEKDQLTLRWLYETKGITWLSFWGIIMSDTDNCRHVLYLRRYEDGSWSWSCRWVDDDRWGAGRPVAVLASSN